MKSFRIVLLLSTFLVTQVYAEKKITHWMTINYPPAYILSGPQKGTGMNDIAMQIMINNLNSFSHEVIDDVTIPRIMHFWRKSGIYCSPGLAVTKNQFSKTLYSAPILIMPPAGVIVLKTEAFKFRKSEKGVYLETVLKDTELKAGIMKSGQYGKYIDNLIHKYKKQNNLYQRVDIDQVALLKMLLSKRVDYLIDYPISFYINAKKLNKEDQKKILFLPINFTQNIKFVRAVCNDNDESKELIEKLNKLLRKKSFKIPVTNSLLNFLPIEIRGKYRKVNMKYIGVPD